MTYDFTGKRLGSRVSTGHGKIVVCPKCNRRGAAQFGKKFTAITHCTELRKTPFPHWLTESENHCLIPKAKDNA